VPTTSRSVARWAAARWARVRALTPAASPRPATHRGPRSGSRRFVFIRGCPELGAWRPNPELEQPQWVRHAPDCRRSSVEDGTHTGCPGAVCLSPTWTFGGKGGRRHGGP